MKTATATATDASFRPGAPWVTAHGVGYSIGASTLLHDVSLALEPGSLVALVGPNGAGKSTLLNLISGDLLPTEGELEVGDRAPRAWRAKDIARRRSVMGQQHEATFAFTVDELVAMGRIPHEASDDDELITAGSMRSAEVDHLADRDTMTLSGGELSRTVFARVLAQTAKLVLLDEPTAALDLKHQESVIRTAARLADDGCCVLVVLHDLNLAARYASRVAMFSRGTLVADGPPDDVLTSERIEAVYGQRVVVMRHPHTARPLIVPA
ncbi:heme ABC transporter ATP-binding protein [Paramicrobacterium chengjingii]|uniref:heme ABC transporter ATP-binding protein n=1 Tax=Paramicrobacterium chengjingii TaxID=2769067 RepID=UPI00142335E2|nr:heme ABC transporter ATP-binding protein [Microbacterium chengjingii]